jgi:hypothetical protein
VRDLFVMGVLEQNRQRQVRFFFRFLLPPLSELRRRRPGVEIRIGLKASASLAS